MGHVLFFSQAIDGVIPAPKIGRCSLSPTLVEMNVRTSLWLLTICRTAGSDGSHKVRMVRS